MIRSFEKRDLARLYQLDQVCFPPEIAYSRAELQYFLTHPNCSCWIAEQADDQLAGFILIERTGRNRRPAGHIVTLDVDPLYRRQGIGRLLMQSADQQLRHEGAAAISLEVAENNTAAQQFYRSLGFVMKGRIANYYGGRVDAEVMEKPL
jgi:ribosomal-protein-alanine N-acetyltransferase